MEKMALSKWRYHSIKLSECVDNFYKLKWYNWIKKSEIKQKIQNHGLKQMLYSDLLKQSGIF